MTAHRRLLLDTNVFSELMKEHIDPAVVRWQDATPWNDTFMSTITVMELLYGVGRIEHGQRRRKLEEQIRRLFIAYKPRILAFDTPAAMRCAVMQVTRERVGRPVGVQDCQIAAIAAVNDCAVVTRNTKDFLGLGIELINPWDSESSSSERHLSDPT
ncbi:type II toxin-antitoxin system VapC family toxin [Bifidobacterium pullorum subsp. saeculare]|uniref:Type II toxin-antitoxin system VapC family toxin n=1 Tax=Bifidobacterium pullorum subsp. saeculare TaxID=78257 RepID=A0A938WVX4_9BIFI|nr:type II toxin-antitoxin system VapC family toxin [Bifidobacterium pullorum]MBM6699234.1 type II toxin-antitoxin system VapC family toxin [Bifidobacterium pullorum subsp. saeculare]